MTVTLIALYVLGGVASSGAQEAPSTAEVRVCRAPGLGKSESGSDASLSENGCSSTALATTTLALDGDLVPGKVLFVQQADQLHAVVVSISDNAQICVQSYDVDSAGVLSRKKKGAYATGCVEVALLNSLPGVSSFMSSGLRIEVSLSEHTGGER